jgi:hypothetical protein
MDANAASIVHRRSLLRNVPARARMPRGPFLAGDMDPASDACIATRGDRTGNFRMWLFSC